MKNKDGVMDLETVDANGDKVIVQDIPYKNHRGEKLVSCNDAIIKGYEQYGERFCTEEEYKQAKKDKKELLKERKNE